MYRYNVAVVFALTLWDMAAAQMDCKPKDCYDLKCYRVSNAQDGPHTIYPSRSNLTSLPVSCDQETDGGGWIMYQRRVDGTFNFTRNWEEYKYGFGDHGDNTTELWMGNEHVYQVLMSYGSSTKWELRIEADAFDGTSCWVVASNVGMYNETRRYAMYWDSVAQSTGELADDWKHHRMKPFNTLDNSEGLDAKRCVGEYKGGWWYEHDRFCGRIFLNGEYENQAVESSTSISVYHFKEQVSLERSRMMLRPQNDVRPCNNPCKNGGTCEYNEATESAKCSCIAQFSGSTCEGTVNGTNNDTHSDADSDADSGAYSFADIVAESNADSDADSDAESDAYSFADIVAESNADSDADSDAESDAHSDADSGADSGADTGADTDAVSESGSESSSTLPVLVGGVGILLSLIGLLIAGAIVVGAMQRRKQREAERNCSTCADTGSYADTDADSGTDSDADSDADTV